MASDFPFEFHDVEASINQQLLADFHGERTAFIQVGPKKYFMPVKYRDFAAEFYSFKLRSDDVFIVTYPRSGTTVMQEMLWLLSHDLDYQAAAKISLFIRAPFLEFNVMVHDGLLQDVLQLVQGNEEMTKQAYIFASCNVPMLQAASSPRVIKSHLPLSLLPPATLDICKLLVLMVVCDAIERSEDAGDGNRSTGRRQDLRDIESNTHPDPEQVCTFLGLNVAQMTLPLDPPRWAIRGFFYIFLFLLSLFILIFVIEPRDHPKGHNFKKVPWCPYWEHLAEAWDQRHHPNMLFLFYEDLVKDCAGVIRRVAAHLGQHLDDAQAEKLQQHLHIDNFRHNSSANLDGEYLPGLRVEGEESFIRKGKNQGWIPYFTPEMNKEADLWINENLACIPDFQFPEP